MAVILSNPQEIAAPAPPQRDPDTCVVCHDEADVEGVVVHVAEDAGRTVGAPVAGGGLRPLQHRHLVSATGEAPRGGGAGQTGPDDDVPRRAHRAG